MSADPDIPYVIREVAHDGVTIAASGSNTSDAVDLRKARDLAWQARNTGASTSVDFEILLSDDNSVFDTLAYDSMNLGSNAKKTKSLTGPVRYAKIKATNNDAVNSAVVTTKFYGKQ